MLDKNVIKDAVNKNYTSFADAVNNELHNKLNDNDVIKQYISDYDNIQDMKNKFSEISQK